jgi:hypothetical protein
MALSLSVVQPSGVIVTYWKVTTMRIDALNETIAVTMGGWIDGPTCASGADPVVTIVEFLPPDAFISIVTASNIIAAFYIAVAALPDFTGATPC